MSIVLYIPYPGTNGIIPGITNAVTGFLFIRANSSPNAATEIAAIKFAGAGEING